MKNVDIFDWEFLKKYRYIYQMDSMCPNYNIIAALYTQIQIKMWIIERIVFRTFSTKN